MFHASVDFSMEKVMEEGWPGMNLLAFNPIGRSSSGADSMGRASACGRREPSAMA
jgi:hypothetical protein